MATKIILFIPAISMCAGIAIGFLFPPGIRSMSWMVVLTMLCLGGVVWGYKVRRLMISDVCVVASFLFLGMVLAQKEKDESVRLKQLIARSPRLTVSGFVEPLKRNSVSGRSTYLLHGAELISDGVRSYSLALPIIVKVPGNIALQAGEKYSLWGKLRVDTLSVLPQAVLSLSKDSAWKILPQTNQIEAALIRLSEFLQARAKEFLSEESFAFFSAFFFGRRDLLSLELKNAFKSTGTYHILSISGLHIAALYFFVFYFLRLVRVPYAARLIGSLCAVGLYCLMAGNSLPTQRSFFTIAVFVATYFARRKIHPFQTLSLVFIALLTMYPWSVYDIGFWLSFCSVFFIVAGFIAIPFRKKPTGLETLLYTSVFAFLGTAPLTVKFFNTLAFGGILINMLIVPLSSLILFCGILSMLLLVIPPFAALSFLTADGLIKLCIFIAASADEHSAFFIHGDRILWPAIFAYYACIIGIAAWRALKKTPAASLDTAGV